MFVYIHGNRIEQLLNLFREVKFQLLPGLLRDQLAAQRLDVLSKGGQVELADPRVGRRHRRRPAEEVARELERIALEDDYFVQRKLYPNVDFYSGIILKAMGFPTEMFTVLFALARTVGWISQWKEMMEHPDGIFRPRQLYTGEKHRSFVDLSQR